MGKRKREHKKAVIEGEEKPIWHEKLVKKRWHFTLPHWRRNK